MRHIALATIAEVDALCDAETCPRQTLNSSTNFMTGTEHSWGLSGALWGLSTDTPVPADYDGDGRFDPAVFRPSTGQWAVLTSSTNYSTSSSVFLGASTDTPINKRP